MSSTRQLPEIYISFFMFTTDMKPDDPDYRKVVVRHIKELQGYGYAGFEFPIKPTFDRNYARDVKSYQGLRKYLDDQGLGGVKISTNVMATRTFDPSSSYAVQQQDALEYLKSRVDITAALGGEIMMGPIVFPYNVYPTSDFGDPIWSDQLQDLNVMRYKQAQPVLNQLGHYATGKKVKLAIEPVGHWETSGPNKLAQLLGFLDGVESRQVGAVIDGAQEVLDGDGPEVFAGQVAQLASQNRLHYIQVSPPDRGAVHTSWFPWDGFLTPVLKVYNGPVAVEIFNAIPAFLNTMHITRRKFWIPGKDAPNSYPSAYDIAQKALEKTQVELKRILGL